LTPLKAAHASAEMVDIPLIGGEYQKNICLRQT
jgi:hypothetical protein